MIPISQAIEIIKSRTSLLGTEDVPLSDVRGRILAEDIFADSDLPPFNRSQMDGFALRAADSQDVPARLRVVGESKAGEGWHQVLKEGEAVRIMTGAPLPEGADAVQKVEVTREADGFVEILEPVKPGQFINPLASEIQNGEMVFSAGQKINKMMIATLASFGYSKVKVARRPTLAVLTTGNEIVAVSEKPQKDQIRDSNSVTMGEFAVDFAEVKSTNVVGDDLESIKQAILGADAQIIVLTGGVSMGLYDFTKTALHELGAEIFIEKVQLKPGKPFVFAKLGDRYIFGLPGNPVSAMVTLLLFVRTAALQMQCAAETELREGFAVLSKEMRGPKERDAYLPASLQTDESGRLNAVPLRFFGSSDFVSFSRCEALIMVPKGETLAEGSVARIKFL